MDGESRSLSDEIAVEVVESINLSHTEQLTPRQVADVLLDAESRTENLSEKEKIEVIEKIGHIASDEVLAEAAYVLRRKRIERNSRRIAGFALATRNSA